MARRTRSQLKNITDYDRQIYARKKKRMDALVEEIKKNQTKGREK